MRPRRAASPAVLTDTLDRVMMMMMMIQTSYTGNSGYYHLSCCSFLETNFVYL